MIEPVQFKPERSRIKPPTLQEALAINGGKLPRIAGASDQSWQVVFNSFQSANQIGVAYKESAAIKDISPGAAVAGEACTFAGGTLIPGSLIRCRAAGWLSTKAATNPTFIMGLYWGGVAGTALAVTAALETPAGAVETTWELNALITVKAIGAAGKMMTSGHVIGLTTPIQSVKLPAIANTLPATKPQTEVGVNTATSNVLSLGGTWGTSSAENTLTVTSWVVELCN